MARIEVYIIVGLATAALVGGLILYIFNKGEDAGSSAVKTEVQSKTIETMEGARAAKEKADADVRATPYEGRVDGLR
jgi:hypothetical protein